MNKGSACCDGIPLVVCRVNVEMSRDEWSMALQACLSLLSQGSASDRKSDMIHSFSHTSDSLSCSVPIALFPFLLLSSPLCPVVSQLGGCQDEGWRAKEQQRWPQQESRNSNRDFLTDPDSDGESFPVAPGLVSGPYLQGSKPVLRQVQFTGTV